WMLDNFKECHASPEASIRHLNGIILKGVNSGGGAYRHGPVKISGMDFEPPPGTAVPAFMGQLADELKSGGVDRSGLEYAAALHTKLVWIHPFIDGNGRTARLLLNAILLSRGLPVIVINYADREQYLHCLAESNKGDLSPLVDYMLRCSEQQIDELVTPPP